MRNKCLSFINEQETEVFENAEEAWFWYCLCEQIDRSQCLKSEKRIVRPCEASDIIIAVKRLIQNGKLKEKHIKVLSRYGYCQTPPHPHFGDSVRICELWREALDFLGIILKKKGIIAG